MAIDSAPLAAEIRRRLGPRPGHREWPLVSIVVPNRDGAAMLRRLLAGLRARTDYPRFELILVDNASTDDSLDLVRRVDVSFPISILANAHNESFSEACNQGAELARGELLLFLNNDIEPFEDGWLSELVACHRRVMSRPAGATSSTLVCPDDEHSVRFAYGYGVQHRGLVFREERRMLVPALRGWESDPLDDRLGEDEHPGAVAAACMMVEREAFERVAGFSHGYVYGAEDIDLCLKLRSAGYDVRCSGRSVVIHHPVSTRRTNPFEEERARKLANRRVLWEHWGPQLRREYELDRIGGHGIWAEVTRGGDFSVSLAKVEALGFCLKVAESKMAPGLRMIALALRRQGHRCLVLVGDGAEDPVGLNYDVAVLTAGRVRYVPKPAQLNLSLASGDLDADPRVITIESAANLPRILGAESPHSLAERLIAAANRHISAVGFRRRVDNH